mmetsp:Transcript_40813/g.73067  ORF Transcript_40813/g.73067 Transcript_40813/m.73067 type:complete len:246 (-) Transcript_40813:984-1721(-)
MRLLNVISLLVVICTYATVIFCANAASPQDPKLLHELPMIDVGYVPFILVAFLQVVYTPKVFDLKEQFAFYGSYHNNVINKVVHFLCIWPILWTANVMFAFTKPIVYLPQVMPYQPTFLAWGPTTTFLGYVIYFCLADPKYCPILVLLSTICLLTAHAFAEYYGTQGFLLAGYIHLAGWVGQFIGHGVFEGRAPSLMDNLAQSFLMAPHFVFLEVLFALGLRRDLQEATHPLIQKRLAAFEKKSK